MKKSQILNQKEKDMIQEFMYSSYDNLKLNQDIKTILSKDLSNLKKNKLILEAITFIIYKMGNNPLITQKELLKKLNSKLETNLTLDEFKHANHQIRKPNCTGHDCKLRTREKILEKYYYSNFKLWINKKYIRKESELSI